MDLDLLWQLAFIFGLVGFGVWFSHLPHKLNRGLDEILGRGDDLDEIREAVEAVVLILNKLPELMPQFSMNTNPLQPIFEAFAQKITGAQQLSTVNVPRVKETGQYATPQTKDN